MDSVAKVLPFLPEGGHCFSFFEDGRRTLEARGGFSRECYIGRFLPEVQLIQC